MEPASHQLCRHDRTVVTQWSQNHQTRLITLGYLTFVCGGLAPFLPAFTAEAGFSGMSGHQAGISSSPPSDTATPGFDAWGLLVFGPRHPPRYCPAVETSVRDCIGQRSVVAAFGFSQHLPFDCAEEPLS